MVLNEKRSKYGQSEGKRLKGLAGHRWKDSYRRKEKGSGWVGRSEE